MIIKYNNIIYTYISDIFYYKPSLYYSACYIFC